MTPAQRPGHALIARATPSRGQLRPGPPTGRFAFGEVPDQIVAAKIVEVVKEVLRDPGEIYERVFNDLQLRK